MAQQNDHVLMSWAFFPIICEALGIKMDKVRRIILDATVLEPVRVYVELLGDQQLLTIDWKDLGPGMSIKYAPKPEDPHDVS